MRDFKEKAGNKYKNLYFEEKAGNKYKNFNLLTNKKINSSSLLEEEKF